MKLTERVARLERGGRNGVDEIRIEGGIDDIGPDDIASAGSMTWRRDPGETVEAFKARVRGEIGAGTRFLIWGGLPE